MELNINALQTEVGVSMGDHGQDVVKAITVLPTMTVQELCETYLTRVGWTKDAVREVDSSKFLTIRLAEPFRSVEGSL